MMTAPRYSCSQAPDARQHGSAQHYRPARHHNHNGVGCKAIFNPDFRQPYKATLSCRRRQAWKIVKLTHKLSANMPETALGESDNRLLSQQDPGKNAESTHNGQIDDYTKRGLNTPYTDTGAYNALDFAMSQTAERMQTAYIEGLTPAQARARERLRHRPLLS